MEAKVLRVFGEGGGTSIVAQMRHSSTVLKCAVGAQSSAPGVVAGGLRAGQTVTLCLLSCHPPEVTVSVCILDDAEPPSPARAPHSLSPPSPPPASPPAQRKRPCFGSLPQP